MNSAPTRARSQSIWYVVWSAMLILSVGDAFSDSAIGSPRLALCVSLLLIVVAGIQMLVGAEFLRGQVRMLSAVLLVVFGVAQLVQFARTMGPPPTTRAVDFGSYYLAGKLMSESPAQNPYQLSLFADGRMNLNLGAEAPMSSVWREDAIRSHVPFPAPYIYPPFFAILMKPLSHFSFHTAYIVWKMIAMLSVVGSIFLSLSLGGVRMDGKLALIFGVGLFSYYPFLDDLYYGQIGGPILLLFTAGVWLLSRSRIWMSALCFAVATLIKLTPALVVPVLIFHRRWKWLTAYVIWMISVLMFSVWQAGWSVHQQFWHSVMPSISCGAPVCQNSSIMAYVQELYIGHVPLSQNAPSSIPAYACAVSRYVTIAVYCLMLVRFFLRRRDGLLIRDLVIMALLGIVISPISWWHHYTLGLLPLVYLWGRMPELGNRLLLVLFLAVGTNVLGITRILVVNHMAELILAAIIPGLTIGLAYVALAPDKDRPVTA